VVLAIATWYWLQYFNRSTNLLDEGSTAAQAMRVLRGELIYRDFFTVVTPFSYYTVAAVFRWFGETLLVLRWTVLVTGIAIALMTLIVARRICGWPFAAAAALMTTVWGWFLVTPNFYSWEAALLSLIALACYVYGAPSAAWVAAAGVATGVTAMTKQNIGAFVFGGLLFTIWASRMFDDRWDVRGRLKMTAQFVAGVGVPVMPTLLWLVANGAGPYLYESWIYYPLKRYPERFSLPFPDFFPLIESDPFDLWTKLVIYMPAIVFPLTMAAIVVLAVRVQRDHGDRASKHEGHALLALWSVGLLILLQAFPRADVPHILFGLQPTFILLAYLCFCAWRLLRAASGQRTILSIGALIVTLLPIAVLLRQGYQRTDWEYQNYIVALRTGRGQGVLTGGLEARRIDIVTQYLTDHSTAGDGVFVVPWASGFNFLANRMNPTRMDFMLFEDPESYPCLLSRLDQHPPKYVVYGYTWDVDGRHFSDYAAPVDRSNRSRNEIEFTTDGYEIWRRIESHSPAPPFPNACQPRRFRISDLLGR
jgi:4-amino-4-deoxy-L-arabinose transferase-like glycosyltransferase